MSMTFDYNRKKFETNWVNDARYQQKNEGKMSEKILKGAEEMKKKMKKKSENPWNAAPKCSASSAKCGKSLAESERAIERERERESVEWFLHLKLISRKLTECRCVCV